MREGASFAKFIEFFGVFYIERRRHGRQKSRPRPRRGLHCRVSAGGHRGARCCCARGVVGGFDPSLSLSRFLSLSLARSLAGRKTMFEIHACVSCTRVRSEGVSLRPPLSDGLCAHLLLNRRKLLVAHDVSNLLVLRRYVVVISGLLVICKPQNPFHQIRRRALMMMISEGPGRSLFVS